MIIMLGLVLLLASYVPVIQPHYDPPYVEGEILITEDNAELVECSEGYSLYVDGEYIDLIGKEEIGVEPYCDLKKYKK